MDQEFNIQGTEHVVEVRSDTSCSCEQCNFWIDADVEAGINHYIEVHGSTLLHIGTESSVDNNGDSYHTTVAFLAD